MSTLRATCFWSRVTIYLVSVPGVFLQFLTHELNVVPGGEYRPIVRIRDNLNLGWWLRCVAQVEFEKNIRSSKSLVLVSGLFHHMDR